MLLASLQSTAKLGLLSAKAEGLNLDGPAAPGAAESSRRSRPVAGDHSCLTISVMSRTLSSMDKLDRLGRYLRTLCITLWDLQVGISQLANCSGQPTIPT